MKNLRLNFLASILIACSIMSVSCEKEEEQEQEEEIVCAWCTDSTDTSWGGTDSTHNGGGSTTVDSTNTGGSGGGTWGDSTNTGGNGGGHWPDSTYTWNTETGITNCWTRDPSGVMVCGPCPE